MADTSQRNFFVIAGISLPLLLVLVLLVGQWVVGRFGADPQHDALIVVYDNGAPDNFFYRFTVRNGQTVVEAMEPVVKEGVTNPVMNYRRPRLYRYEAKQQNIREIAVSAPVRGTEAAPATGSWQVIEVPELSGVKVSSYKVSPDGYQLEQGNRYYRGVLGIGDSGYKETFVLRKGAKRVPLPLGDGSRYYSNDYQFIGWVE